VTVEAGGALEAGVVFEPETPLNIVGNLTFRWSERIMAGE
jgi:hypothetical protein